MERNKGEEMGADRARAGERARGRGSHGDEYSHAWEMEETEGKKSCTFRFSSAPSESKSSF